MSAELIPLSEHYRQRETLSDVPHIYHDGLITPEQSRQISNRIDIHIVGAFHGAGEGAGSDVSPYDEEYAVLLPLLDSLDASRGDRLFVECGAGYANGTITLSDLGCTSDELVARMQDMRAQQTIDTFEYAVGLALARGMAVTPIDMSATTLDGFLAAVGEPDPFNIHRIWLSDPPAYRGELDRQREKQMRNIVKDAGVEYVAQPQQPGHDRRRFVVLVGEMHMHEALAGRPALPTAFQNLGLATTQEILPNMMHIRGLRRF